MLTLTASYDEAVLGDPQAPVLTIGGTAIAAADFRYSVPVGSGSSNSRIWTYTISASSPTGAITLSGGNFLADSATQAIHDKAGNSAVLSNGTLPTLSGTFTADSAAPTTPRLSLPTEVSGGATRSEATASSGVVLIRADSGNTVVLTFSDMDDRSVSKTVTITATAGTSQAVTLDAADLYNGTGTSTAQLHDGTITVSAVARNAAGITSNPGLTLSRSTRWHPPSRCSAWQTAPAMASA